MTSELPQTERETIDAEAVDWVIRLGAKAVSDEDRTAFEEWLTRGHYHGEAYDAAQQTWAALGSDAAREESRKDGESTAVPQHANDQDAVRDPARRRFVWRAAAAIAATAGGAAVFGGDIITAARADIRTGVGERRVFRLPDGSTAHLNTNSALVLDMSGARRAAVLLEGEAVFSVTRATAPLEVAAGDITAAADRAVFHVSRLDDAVRVSAIDTEVRIAERPGDRAGGLRLKSGQYARWSGGVRDGGLRAFDSGRALAWRSGRLRFEDTPLRDVIAELERYRRGRIVILNPDLSSRTLSGIFNLDQIDGAPALIADELGARIADGSPLVTALY